MNRLRYTLLAAICAALCLPVTAAFAQWRNPYTGSNWNNPTSSLIDTMVQGRLMAKLINKKASAQKASAGSEQAQAGERRAVRVTYRPAASRVPEELAATVFAEKEQQAELARYLKDAMTAYSREAAKVGRSNDLGFALTFFVGGNYSVFNEQDVPDAATDALSRQIDDALGGIESIAKARDRQRQRLAEHLVCATALAMAGYQQGKEKGSTEQVAQFRELAGLYLKALLGIEPARLTLTASGIAQR